jgi:hypothetical protein
MRFHVVDGYVALKQPAPGNRFCASERCQESIELAVLPAEIAAVPAGGNGCVELEHAESAADRPAIEISRGKFNSLTFLMDSPGDRSYDDCTRRTFRFLAVYAMRLKRNVNLVT